jgi:branched-chain amino acid transport system substrate-binding protein
LGQVVSLTGILGPLAAPARAAIAAWTAAVNARGGVACHPVVVYTKDDAGDPAQAAAAVQELVEEKHVQALVGTHTIISMNGLIAGIEKEHVPVVGGDLAGFAWNNHPLLFPQGPAEIDMIRAGLEQIVRTGTPKVAVLYCVEAPVCTAADKLFPGEAAKAGAQVVMNTPISLGQTDFTAQCLNARGAGAQVLRTIADGATIGRIARSCAAVGYFPKLLGVSVGTSAEQAGDPAIRRDTLILAGSTAPWTRRDSTGQREFLDALARFAPGLLADGNSITAWAAGKLLEAAVAGLGPAARDEPLTTARILDGLGRIHNETLGGLTTPITFTPGQTGAPRPRCAFLEVLTVSGWTTPQDSRPLCFPTDIASSAAGNGAALGAAPAVALAGAWRRAGGAR